MMLSVRRVFTSRSLAGLMALGLLATAIIIVPSAYADPDADNQGTEFMLAFMQNFAGSSPINRLLITGDTATGGTVEIPGIGFTTSFSVTPGALTALSLPSASTAFGSDVVSKKGVRVAAEAEINVYGLNQRSFSSDGFLGLPVDILGTDYLVLGRNEALSSTGFSHTQGPSELVVAAVEDGTTVTITPSISTGVRPAGVPYAISMNRFETYALDSDDPLEDLSGTTIASDRPIAVFAGARCSNVPNGIVFCDHLVEQLPSTDTWGTTFLTVSLATRTAGDRFRVMARDDGTEVRIDGTLVSTLAAGTFHEADLPSGTTHAIETSGPALVMQYAKGTGADNVDLADPFMMMVLPTEQFRAHYSVAVSPGFSGSSFLNVVAPTSDVGSCTLDGGPFGTAFSAIGSSDFSATREPVASGAHVLDCASAFGVYVYGYGSFNSYGYPGGFQVLQAPQSPRDLKESALSELESIRITIEAGASGVGDSEEAIEEIEEAIEGISESLDPDLWARTSLGEIDPFRLDPEEGEEVFEEESEAAEAIFEAIDDGEITSSALIEQLLFVVDLLVRADRLLSQTAIDDAKADPDADQEEITEAEASLAEGDRLVERAAEADLDRAEDLIEDAIEDAYGEAWEDALEALEGDEDDDEDDED